jgi:peptidoglycan hydrolase-like protein with peptidoglycan-binding domain
VAIPFTASKHPRGAGGLFAATAAANGKPTGAWAAGPVQSGAAHGGKTDPRVKALQQALNKLGITDERGRPLLVDGKPGAHTSAAIKKWQSAHGMKPTGTIDAKAMVALLSAKPAAKRAAAKMSRPKASAHRPALRRPAGKKTASKKPLTSAQKTAAAKAALADKRGQSRLGG